MDNTNRTINEMQAINDMLDTALEHGLEIEVIYWALEFMKKDPSATPAEAFALGISEWVK